MSEFGTLEYSTVLLTIQQEVQLVLYRCSNFLNVSSQHLVKIKEGRFKINMIFDNHNERSLVWNERGMDDFFTGGKSKNNQMSVR